MIRVAFPAREFSRGEAWDLLRSMLIPGAPIWIDSPIPQVMNPWRKAHTGTEYAWVYEGPGPLGRPWPGPP